MSEKPNVERKPRNPLNEALPQVFNREGAVKKGPNKKATNRDFNRIINRVSRTRAAIQQRECNLVITLPIGEIALNRDYSIMLAIVDETDDDGDILLSLMLNGWEVGAE
jgi:hypothetical protein